MTQSEFQHINSPGSFGKAKRQIFFDAPLSPGPAAHYKEAKEKTAGGVIDRQKKVVLFENKEQMVIPGPMDYIPKYHYVSKH